MYLHCAYQLALDEMPGGKTWPDWCEKSIKVPCQVELIKFDILALFKLGIHISGLKKTFHIQIHSLNQIRKCNNFFCLSWSQRRAWSSLGKSESWAAQQWFGGRIHSCWFNKQVLKINIEISWILVRFWLWSKLFAVDELYSNWYKDSLPIA